MPEYSSTTITPADGVQVPSMNGSTSGNFLLSALRDYILASKGQANGLASLGSDGKLTPSQLPDLADDVIVVASYAVLPATGTAGKIYITADNNKMYRWDSDLSTPDYVELSVDLSEYAKLTDLAAEETARETADANLNNAINQLDHRLDNLEQSKGDYIVSSYKDGSITPSGKGAWAVVEGLRGVSRVENQMIQNYNFADTSVWEASTGVGFSVSGNVATISYDTAYRGIYQRISISKGHKYLVRVDLKKVDADAGVQVILTDSSHFTLIVSTDNVGTNWTTCCGVVSTDTEIGTSFMYIRNGSSGYASAKSVQARNVVLTDLSVYFAGDPSVDVSSLTIAEIQTNYPHLLTPSEYGTRIVDSSYSGVRAWGVNLIDASNLVADSYVESLTGIIRVVSGVKRTDYMRVKGGESYFFGGYITANSGNTGAYFDINKNFLGAITNDSDARPFVAPANCAYVVMNFWLNKWGDLATTAYFVPYDLPHVWSPYMENTLSLTYTGKSAGSVYDSCEPNVEVEGVARKRETEKVGTIVYDGSDDENWTKGSGNNFYSQLNTLIKAGSEGYADRLLCDRLIPVINQSSTDFTQGTKVVTGYRDSGGNYPNQNWLYVRIDDTITSVALLKAWLAQNPITVYYELAEESVTLSDPILDNTLLTEGGGRLSTVQTGTVVDGSFDMGFITL